MKLIVGLGNPGKKYTNTWHNIGFKFLDLWLQNHKDFFSSFKLQKKWQAETSEGIINKKKIILCKPQTFMNESGKAVSDLSHFYNIEPKNIIVIYDDIDLAFGSIKIKQGGSSGGHKGVQSIINQLNNSEFIRLKIGICPEKKPANTAAFVLKTISSSKEKKLQAISSDILEAINLIISGEFNKAMNKINKKSLL